jgi:AcrR family transcriptional regulator
MNRGLGTPRQESKSDAHRRLVCAATDLFYAEGIRSVPIERILERARVTRSTLYRYFGTKEELVLAYLDKADRDIRVRFAEAAAGVNDPGGLLTLMIETIRHDVCGPEFRGCPFINAAAEYADSDHPVRRAVRDHRAWFIDCVRQVLTDAHHPDAPRASRALATLRDGTMVGGYLDDKDDVTDALVWAVHALVGGLSYPADQ